LVLQKGRISQAGPKRGSANNQIAKWQGENERQMTVTYSSHAGRLSRWKMSDSTQKKKKNLIHLEKVKWERVSTRGKVGVTGEKRKTINRTSPCEGEDFWLKRGLGKRSEGSLIWKPIGRVGKKLISPVAAEHSKTSMVCSEREKQSVETGKWGERFREHGKNASRRGRKARHHGDE